MSKVWQTRQDEHDTSDAKKWGELQSPIFPRAVSPLDMQLQERIIREIVMPNARWDDYVLTVGPQIMVVTLSSILMQQFGVVNLLVWDRRRGYVFKYIGERPD
jgi:hypothetical protein